jgi:hypothetical protein
MRRQILPIVLAVLLVLPISCLKQSTTNNQGVHSPKKEQAESQEPQLVTSIPGLNDLDADPNANLGVGSAADRANPSQGGAPEEPAPGVTSGRNPRRGVPTRPGQNRKGTVPTYKKDLVLEDLPLMSPKANRDPKEAAHAHNPIQKANPPGNEQPSSEDQLDFDKIDPILNNEDELWPENRADPAAKDRHRCRYRDNSERPLSPEEAQLLQAAEDSLKKIKEARNQIEYNQNVVEYDALRRRLQTTHVTFCLPDPPKLNPELVVDPNERACKEGYSVGWKHGKKWAYILRISGHSLEMGQEKLKCLLQWASPNFVDILQICAYKGATAGFSKWFELALKPEDQERFEKLEEMEEDQPMYFEPRTEMNAREEEYARSLGISVVHPNNV